MPQPPPQPQPQPEPDPQPTTRAPPPNRHFAPAPAAPITMLCVRQREGEREGAGRTVCLEFKVNQRMLSGLVDNLELSQSIKIDFNGAKSQSTEAEILRGIK